MGPAAVDQPFPPPTAAAPLTKPSINPHSEGEVEFKEGTWEVVWPDECEFKVTVNGTSYKMAQFHFHNAEHTVN